VTSRLRWFGAAVLILNLWLIGRYNITGPTVLVLTFGFAIGFELIVVRAATSSSARPDASLAKPHEALATSQEVAPGSSGQATLDQQANDYGIVSEAGRYRYKDYWYDRLEDAVAYAEIDRSRVTRCK